MIPDLVDAFINIDVSPHPQMITYHSLFLHLALFHLIPVGELTLGVCIKMSHYF